MSKGNEAIEALEARIAEYEAILQEALGSAHHIAKVKSGPHTEDGKKYYRVASSGGSEMMVISSFGEEIPKDSEVVVTDTVISRILPKKLATIKEVPEFQRIDWGEVGGLRSQIDEIRKHIEGPLTYGKLFKEFGIQPSKGALLYGPPGCGKTLISRVIASKIIDPKKGNEDSFVYIKGPEILSPYVGATESKIRKIFDDCRKNSKKSGSRSVIFIDEAEALLSRRGSGISSDVNRTIVPQFLSEMDGFDEDSPFVLLSTNIPEMLDPAIIREGRIDIKIEIKRPTQEDAEEIFGIHLKKVKLSDKIEDLCKSGAGHLYTKGHPISGSMIKTIVNVSAQNALYRHIENKGKKGIILEDLISGINTVTNSQIQ